MRRHLVIQLLLTLLMLPSAAAQSVDLTEALISGEIEFDLGAEFWRFHPGDVPAWSDPSFADSTWELTPAHFKADSLQEWTGIGWFRIRLDVDSTLANSTIALRTYNLGASEIYLDGNLAASFGYIGQSAATDTVDAPKGLPIGLHFDNAPSHILAVRYSNRSVTPRHRDWINEDEETHTAGFSVTLAPLNEIVRNYAITASTTWTMGLISGVLFLMFIVHGLLFWLDRTDPAQVYLALFALILLIGINLKMNTAMATYVSAFQPWTVAFAHRSTTYALLSLLWVVHQTFRGKVPGYIKIWTLVMVLLSIEYSLNAPDRIIPPQIYLSGFYLAAIELVRVQVLAIVRRSPGAWIMVVGTVVMFAGWGILIVVNPAHTNVVRGLFSIPGVTQGAMAVLVVAMLPFPISASILLAQRFARTSSSLRSRMREVEKLSAEALTAEREKQTLIEGQKEKLEITVAERTSELSTALEDLKIESALERVRSEAMSMHSSDDIGGVALKLFDEVKTLCPELIRSGIGILNDADYMEAWGVTKDNTGNSVLLRGGFARGDREEIPAMLDAIQTSSWHSIDETEDFRSWVAKVMYRHSDQDIADRDELIVPTVDGAHVYSTFKALNPVALYVVAGSSIEPDSYTGNVIDRFVSVFSMAYRRYNDLATAEAQTREAQIGIAVERVRAKALAMHTSDDLLSVAAALKDEVSNLGISGITAGSIWQHLPDGSTRVRDLTDFEDRTTGDTLEVDLIIDPAKVPPDFPYLKVLNLSEGYQVLEFNFEELVRLEKWYRGFDPAGADQFKELLDSGQFSHVWMSAARLDNGVLSLDMLEPPPDEMESILVQMGSAFNLAYRRFEDLQKAEARTREAQIEAALERVRGRALAMRTTDELLSIAEVVTDQLVLLGLNMGSAFVSTVDEERDVYGLYTCCSERHPLEDLRGKSGAWTYSFAAISDNSTELEFLSKWNQDEPFRRMHIPADEFDAWYDTFEDANTELGVSKERLRPVYPNGLFTVESLIGSGSLGLLGHEDYSDEDVEILVRFANEFRGAYTRFKDIQKAEEQAREAQIEAALERLRARTMAMQQASELREASQIFATQLHELGFTQAGVYFALLDEEAGTMELWSVDSRLESTSGVGAPEAKASSEYIFPLDLDDPDAAGWFNAWKEQVPFRPTFIAPDDMDTWYEAYKPAYDEIGQTRQDVFDSYPEGVHTSDAFMRFGILGALAATPFSDEENNILHRFAVEFERTYTRFLDLQKAEEQAREAQIEAALERLRARTMAMQQASELRATSQDFALQLKELGFKPASVYFAIMSEESQSFELWIAQNPSKAVDESRSGMHTFPFDVADPDGAGWLEAWRRGDSFRPTVIRPEDMPAWYDAYKPVLDDAGFDREEILDSYPDGAFITDAYTHFGFLGATADAPFSDEENEILHRFGIEFERTYTRFLDLQRAEDAARESQIEAALERVRSAAMAMQIPDDIGDVSILLFDELEKLGIQSLRSGISLPLDDSRYEFRAATKRADGSTTLVIGNESTHVHEIIARAYEGWKKQEPFQAVLLKEQDLLDYYHAVFDSMPLPDWQVRMKSGAETQESFTTFAFSDGWLYAFTREEMGDEFVQIFIRFARVFGLAYQRFHDLTKAEKDYQSLLAEKSKTEEALSNLQSTQAQLVQSEKLASLGALTAGIAHEIKNPLNFVNNFAEVSAEMMDELGEAVAEGDTEEVATILTDLRENATQIAKHGKRADSIVKSMMQHARGGASEFETIDLNIYLEEYANLAWHGMRARDHGFQTDLIREFDDSIGEISVMPQEFGRVILNLLNNAFDAVKNEDAPSVTISTSAMEGTIRITVSDNGPGIPPEIREKIFEPFFTTKATGEGTGLGLSLSYDIVTKGHGGSLVAGTSDSGGAAFTLIIPGSN